MSIRLQEFPHWIFLSPCGLLTSNANLRVASTSVWSQSCFVVICAERCGTPFSVSSVPSPLHPWIPTARPSLLATMKAASQHFSRRASFKPIWSILSKLVPHLQRASCKCWQIKRLSLYIFYENVAKNETSFTSLKSYYEINIIACYLQYIYLFSFRQVYYTKEYT